MIPKPKPKLCPACGRRLYQNMMTKSWGHRIKQDMKRNCNFKLKPNLLRVDDNKPQRRNI